MVMGEFTVEAQVLVVGGGPGGYAAAFRAADLGLDVTIVDAGGRLGGVCLFRGCIPSKTLLHVAEIMDDARRAEEMGVDFGKPTVDLDRLRAWKNAVTEKLAGGLLELCKRRGIQLIKGRATFESPDTARLSGADVARIRFKHAIIASGSTPRPLPDLSFRQGGRIMNSTGALALADVPGRLLVVGGGYVGVEIGSIYAALGSRVTLVEGSSRLLAGADADLVRPLQSRLSEIFETIHFKTGIRTMSEGDNAVEVVLDGEESGAPMQFDRVLVAVGRSPGSEGLGLENTRVEVDGRGFIRIDGQCRTAQPNIFAVGDIVGGAMLAHKAMYEGKVAAEVIAGKPSAFDVQAIPAVVYTNPQLAWCGLTEEEARKQGRRVKVTRFSWSASGRAVSMGVGARGLTKIVGDAESGRLLGMGIVGREAGEMISEGVLAIEMGALAEDVALTMHPHPTLSESEEEAAEAFLGTATHIMPATF